MGVGFVTVALVSKGAVIRPGDKAALKLRQVFLKGVRDAFTGTGLWNKLYGLHKELQPGDGGSLMFPDGEFPEVRLKPEVGQLPETIALHLKEKSIIASPDERVFIEAFLVPQLKPKISGQVTQSTIYLCAKLKSDLLAGVSANVSEVIGRYLPKRG